MLSNYRIHLLITFLGGIICSVAARESLQDTALLLKWLTNILLILNAYFYYKVYFSVYLNLYYAIGFGLSILIMEFILPGIFYMIMCILLLVKAFKVKPQNNTTEHDKIDFIRNKFQ